MKIPNKDNRVFNPSAYVCYPAQQAVWQRLWEFLRFSEERALIIEAPKGGGKTWFLLFLHWLANRKEEESLPDSCQGIEAIQKVAQALRLAKDRAFLVAGERWEPDLQPAVEAFVLPSGGVLGEQDVREEVAEKLATLWGLEGVPRPWDADAQATFVYALRRRLEEVSARGMALLLVDAPEALSEEDRRLLEEVVLGPYLDSPGGKVVLALRLGAKPAWQHPRLREAERVLLPGLDEDALGHFLANKEMRPAEAQTLLDYWKRCPEQVRSFEGKTLDVPPLLVDLWAECRKEDAEQDALRACLRKRWSRHAFRHHLREEEGRDDGMIELATEGQVLHLPISLWHDWLGQLVRRYTQRLTAGGFDPWDWAPPESSIDPWAVYNFLLREGLMRFSQKHGWWLDPSLCALFYEEDAETSRKEVPHGEHRA